MATYALGFWNASLILDPTQSIKKKKSVKIIQTKWLELTSQIISVHCNTKDDRPIFPWKTEYVLIQITLPQSGNLS